MQRIYLCHKLRHGSLPLPRYRNRRPTLLDSKLRHGNRIKVQKPWADASRRKESLKCMTWNGVCQCFYGGLAAIGFVNRIPLPEKQNSTRAKVTEDAIIRLQRFLGRLRESCGLQDFSNATGLLGSSPHLGMQRIYLCHKLRHGSLPLPRYRNPGPTLLDSRVPAPNLGMQRRICLCHKCCKNGGPTFLESLKCVT